MFLRRRTYRAGVLRESASFQKTGTVNVFSFLTLYDVRLHLSCDKCFFFFFCMCHDIKLLSQI